ncbi:hypothetical protein ACFZCP_30690 [Streptomyces sp. NPDC007971]
MEMHQHHDVSLLVGARRAAVAAEDKAEEWLHTCDDDREMA